MTVTRRTVIVLVLLGTAGLCALGMRAAFHMITGDAAERRRIHDANVVKAEAFEREFDAAVATGTALTDVEAYLRRQPVTVVRSLDARSRVKELLIEVAAERSVNWYCGQASVGIIANFDAERFTSSHVSSWSFDCP